MCIHKQILFYSGLRIINENAFTFVRHLFSHFSFFHFIITLVATTTTKKNGKWKGEDNQYLSAFNKKKTKKKPKARKKGTNWLCARVIQMWCVSLLMPFFYIFLFPNHLFSCFLLISFCYTHCRCCNCIIMNVRWMCRNFQLGTYWCSTSMNEWIFMIKSNKYNYFRIRLPLLRHLLTVWSF